MTPGSGLEQFFRAAEDLLAKHAPGGDVFARVGALLQPLAADPNTVDPSRLAALHDSSAGFTILGHGDRGSTLMLARFPADAPHPRSGGLLVLGFLTLFSIGLPLLVMGLLTGAALMRVINRATGRDVAARASIAGALTAVLVMLAGFGITERIIACPPGAVSGGGGGGLLSGPYSYTCQNGRAIVTYGP